MSKSTPATGLDKPAIVIKLGGSMVEQLSDEFYNSFHELKKHYHCLIVHGGGPAITGLLEKLQIKGEFHDGLRKTNAETLEVVEMTLGGKVNSQITSRLSSVGISSIGIKGSDANLITATMLDEERFGFVGETQHVDTTIIEQCLQFGYTPVIAPLGKTGEGQTVNINADLAASAIAKAVGAEKLLFVTDVPGILRDDELIEETTPEEIHSLIDVGVIYGGMIPKVQSAMEVLSDHMQEVMIVSGERPLIQNEQMLGTKIVIKRKEGVE
ncbi:acetylglutamate kinase [Halobacillus litoralis]|uniref:acetylglutamate kinase n=1 Tax=Halobacillus litoralis TaxID=45668 RepID=UPI001CD2B978|nr:acetylglutamate kinase [Halobacillus litoralis]MCA0971236.1 acetylglutamate kinase [Halobacillus litoralis]